MVWIPEAIDAIFGRVLARSQDHIIKHLNHMEKRIMAALDDLKAAITGLTDEVTDAVTEIEALLAKITTPGTSDADVTAAADAIKAITGNLKTEVDKAKGAAP